MNKNVGMLDRAVRFTVAAVALVLAFAVLGIASPAGIAAAVFGVVMLATGAARVCPLYAPLGFSTCKRSGRP